MKNKAVYILSIALLSVMLFSNVPFTNAANDYASQFARDADATLLINEVLFNPEPGGFEWVELKNIGPEVIDISGFTLTDQDDNWYHFPEGMPPVPVDAFVMVIFDGAGSDGDDLDFSDNVAVLHSQAGLVDIFEDDADQVSLYRQTFFIILPLVMSQGSDIPMVTSRDTRAGHYLAGSLRAFVAWGAPPMDDAANAQFEGLWNLLDFIDLTLGGHGANNFSIGLCPGALNGFFGNWHIFDEEDVTPADENPPELMYP